MNHPVESGQSATWQMVQKLMESELDAKRALMDDPEFHDFLEYFIAETVFNATAEMAENLDIGHESDSFAATEQ